MNAYTVPVPPPGVPRPPSPYHVPAPTASVPRPPSRVPSPRAVRTLVRWMPRIQHLAVLQYARSAESMWYLERCQDLCEIIDTMPGTYDQDGLGRQAVAYLHYFRGGCDWWILETDTGAAGDLPEAYQTQCYGWASIGGDHPEPGYISIPELLAAGAELDLHFTPTRISDILDARK
jgi:hypothetical protein